MIAREGIVGRDGELGIIAGLVAKATAGGGALLIHGDTGIGTSALLERAVVLAQGAGMWVLRTTGVRTEANLPFAGLHQLLRPILAGLETLPKPQYAALGAAFVLVEGAAEDPFLIALATLDVRERSKDTLSRHGLAGFGAAVAAKLAWFVVLEVALWSVGITPDILPPSVVLAAMAVVALVALIPITPGAVGVSEVAYIGFLTAVAGEGLTGQITAAIVIFRAMQWLAPIPIGWILLVIMRGSHWREIEGLPEHQPV